MKRLFFALFLIFVVVENKAVAEQVFNVYNQSINPSPISAAYDQILQKALSVPCSVDAEVEITAISEDKLFFYLKRYGRLKVFKYFNAGAIIAETTTPMVTRVNNLFPYVKATLYRDKETGLCRIKLPEQDYAPFVMKD